MMVPPSSNGEALLEGGTISSSFSKEKDKKFPILIWKIFRFLLLKIIDCVLNTIVSYFITIPILFEIFNFLLKSFKDFFPFQ